jgi:hypothetical protein
MGLVFSGPEIDMREQVGPIGPWRFYELAVATDHERSTCLPRVSISRLDELLHVRLHAPPSSCDATNDNVGFLEYGHNKR